MERQKHKPYVARVLKPFSEPAVVYDVDGVLVDNTERLKRSLEELGAPSIDSLGTRKREFWELFLSEKYIHLDKPVQAAIDLAREKSKKHPIVIITGRPEKLARATLEQLKNFGIPYNAVIFRGDSSYVKDYELKDLAVRELAIDVLEAHDDSLEVCKTMLRHARHGVYWWRSIGSYVYLPPAIVVLDGKKISVSELTYEKVLKEVSKPHTIEYAGEIYQASNGFKAMKILDSIKKKILEAYRDREDLADAKKHVVHS